LAARHLNELMRAAYRVGSQPAPADARGTLAKAAKAADLTGQSTSLASKASIFAGRAQRRNQAWLRQRALGWARLTIRDQLRGLREWRDSSAAMCCWAAFGSGSTSGGGGASTGGPLRYCS
jgi:hypothetical protein